MKRLERLRALLDEHGQKLADYDAGEEEDLRPYFEGQREPGRWCCVTVNYTHHGEGKYFFLPEFEDADVAAARAVEHAEDDIFEEIPVGVVDLDSGTWLAPDWTTLKFKDVAK